MARYILTYCDGCESNFKFFDDFEEVEDIINDYLEPQEIEYSIHELARKVTAKNDGKLEGEALAKHLASLPNHGTRKRK